MQFSKSFSVCSLGKEEVTNASFKRTSLTKNNHQSAVIFFIDAMKWGDTA